MAACGYRLQPRKRDNAIVALRFISSLATRPRSLKNPASWRLVPRLPFRNGVVRHKLGPAPAHGWKRSAPKVLFHVRLRRRHPRPRAGFAAIFRCDRRRLHSRATDSARSRATLSRRACRTDQSKRSISLHSHGINHQRVALVVADGITTPGWFDIRRMWLVQAHGLMVFVVKDRHLVGLLQNLHPVVFENEQDRFGPKGRLRLLTRFRRMP
jgi:hypothetical protein